MAGLTLTQGRRAIAATLRILALAFALSVIPASTALAGNLFATGHDQDYHCVEGASDSCAYYQVTTTFVRNGSSLPLLILDRDSTDDGAAGSSGDASFPLEAVEALNLAYSADTSTDPGPDSPPYVVEDPEGLQPTIINGTPPPGVTGASVWADTPLVNSIGQPLWSAIIVASDTNCGGCDLNDTDGTHLDSDAINVRSTDINTFFDEGGGLLYLAGATDAYDADDTDGDDVYYASVPITLGGQPVSPPFTVSSAGAALGITDDMVNCCATHNSFTLPPASSPIVVAETDDAGLAESLYVENGSVCAGAFCANSTLAASLSGGGMAGAAITVPGGTPVTDSATLSGGDAASATGTVTYNVYSDSACTALAAAGVPQPIGSAGSLPASPPVALTTPGTYYWIATYSGDANNPQSQTKCGDEIETVTPGQVLTHLTTASALPTVVSTAPKVTGTHSAAFSATVVPGGLVTTTHFEYGLDPRYTDGSHVVYNQATPAATLPADFADHSLSASTANLLPNAEYHVRLVATNALGTVDGPDKTFTTKSDPAPPPPVLGKSADITPVSGVVFVKAPAGKSLGPGSATPEELIHKGIGYMPLTEARQVPVGSQIDARRGTLRLEVAAPTSKRTRSATLSTGLFDFHQERSGIEKGLTTFHLLEGAFPGAPSYSACRAGTHKRSVRPAKRHGGGSTTVLQTLNAHDNGGMFRTQGRYSAGTVRGTTWNVSDRCDGTLTVVKRGSVSVRDFSARKTVIVTAGHRYLAKAVASDLKKHRRAG